MMSDTRQEWKGFCFGCPDILAGQERSTPHLLNAWPLLAANPTLKKIRTNPLTRMVYMFTYSRTPFTTITAIKDRRLQQTTSHATDKAQNDFRTWALCLHEFGHQMLDWTPAKELARLVLTLCYTDIAQILYDSVKTAEKAWGRFIEHARSFQAISSAIEFVDELIATELMLKAMETHTRHPNGWWPGFHDLFLALKAEWVTSQEKQFPDFKALHEKSLFQSFISQIYGNPVFFANVIPFLQPVEDDGERLFALNALESLNSVLQLIKDAENVEVATEQLRLLDGELGPGWHKALSLQFDIAYDSRAKKEHFYRSLFMQRLWEISRPDKPEKGSVKDTKEATWQVINQFRTSIAQGSMLGPDAQIWQVWLHPYFSRGSEFITGSYVGGLSDSPSSEDIKESHVLIMLYESIMEQLLSKKGIICPVAAFPMENQNPHICRCSKGWRKVLERLYHFGRDWFGPEESSGWSNLSCK